MGMHRSAYPQIDPDAWVAPTATVAGDVVIAAECGIWHAAVIRTEGVPIRIGQGSNIQDGCVIHADPGFAATVGERVSVGHGAILHGCTVEDDVLVGMGAIILNGARICRESLVGAGTLIPEGMVVPEGSLVLGSPGRVVRETTAQERERIVTNAKDYVARRPLPLD
ncbi:MAG: gamma carbonic anhydrase family protein [Nostocoides sp.]